jgi:sugar lactone lactonase YvrE
MSFPLPRRVLLASSLLLSAYAAQDFTTPYYFTTLAGTVSEGEVDGPVAGARFRFPNSVAVDATGNIYVGDTNNHLIRKISAAGIVTTLAGNSHFSATVDGTGSAANFSYLESVAVDASGNVYVAETFNHVIRKVTPAGVVTTLAGSPNAAGRTDGTGSAARFWNPCGLAVGPAGDIFVADRGYGLIRKITPAGVVTTLAGGAGLQISVDGQGAAANFYGLTGLAIDAAGTLYAVDVSGVRKISPTGNVTTLATANPSANINDPGAASYLCSPWGLAVDATGNVYVSDTRGAVRKITPAGAVSTLAGDPRKTPDASDGPGSAASFFYPLGLAIDSSGNLYVAEGNNNTVRKITPAGLVTTLAGVAPSRTKGYVDGTGVTARFRDPADTAVDAAGNVYVADTGNHAIRKVTRAGVVTTFAGTGEQAGNADGTGSAARFNQPMGIVFDSAGNLYVSDSGNTTIRKVTSAGGVTTLATGVPGRGLSVDTGGNVYVADPNGGVIRKVTAGGTVSIVAGPGPFNAPTDVAVDPTGSLFVADSLNAVIRKIAVGGAVSTFAGQLNSSVVHDGAADAARFSYPHSLAIDGTGNLYVTEYGARVVRKITTAGGVSSLGGGPAGYQRLTGLGRDALFMTPQGISVDAGGTIAFVDEQMVHRGERAGSPSITTQPQSQTVASGGSVQFSVAAAGAPEPTYQWYFNGTAFSGGTSSTLSFSSARATDAGDYTVVVANSLGSVTSSKATLTVNAAPPPSGGSGGSGGGSSGGGGGGAPTLWFSLILSLLILCRHRPPAPGRSHKMISGR